MAEVSREDLNGLGKRVNQIERSLATCQGRSDERVRHNQEKYEQVQAHVDTLFNKIDHLNTKIDEKFEKVGEKLNGLLVKLAAVTGGVTIFFQVVAPMIAKLIGD